MSAEAPNTVHMSGETWAADGQKIVIAVHVEHEGLARDAEAEADTLYAIALASNIPPETIVE